MVSLLARFTHFNLGIDLGTDNTRIMVEDKGLVVDEPTLVARQKKKGGEILAVGKRAKSMVGKEPRQIEVVAPIRAGVIADFDAALGLMNRFLSRVREIPGKWWPLLGPEVVVAVPSGATEVERRAVKAIMVKSGAREVFLIEKPMAAAIGMELPVEEPGGILLVDLGGGTVEMAVISLGGIVLNRCLKFGGNQMDEAIVNYLRLKYGILIGQATAEKIKNELGVVHHQKKEGKKMIVRGRDLESGLPKSIRVEEGEVMEALMPVVQKILKQLGELLEEMPAELTNDVLKRGICLTGGGANLRGWERLVSEETKMPAWRPENPLTSVVKGCAWLLKNRSLLKRVRLVAGLK